MKRQQIYVKIFFVCCYQVLLLLFPCQVKCDSGPAKPTEDGAEGKYADIRINYVIDPSDMSIEHDLANHRGTVVGYDVHTSNEKYDSNDNKLFKRGTAERRARAKIRKMMKQNRLFHQGRTRSTNSSTAEENGIVDKSKTIMHASHERKHTFVKENPNNNYAKPSSVREDNKYKTKSKDYPKNEVFEVSNISNVKEEDKSYSSERNDRTGSNTQLTVNNIDELDNTSNSSTRRPGNNADISKDKKESVNNKRAQKGKYKYLKPKRGFLKKLLRRKKKKKRKGHTVTERNKFENINEANNGEHFENSAAQANFIKSIESRKSPAEGLSYGLEENLTNLSLINHGFLKAFEQRYYDNHHNETATNNIINTIPEVSLENYTAYGHSLKSKPMPNAWKAWDGFNVGDYYEPLYFFTDKEPSDSKSLMKNQKSQTESSARELENIPTKYSQNNIIESQNLISKEKSDKVSFSNYHIGKGLHDKNKNNMISSKSKNKVHVKSVVPKKTRGTRDIRKDNRKQTHVYSSDIFYNDNDSSDYDENKEFDFEMDKGYSDVERPKLVFQPPEHEDSYLTFHRSKKDDSYFKKPRSNKLKIKSDVNGLQNVDQFRVFNSRKTFESNYNGDEHESTETCIGYKSDIFPNTTETITTVDAIESTITTKGNNNGKPKLFAKSKKVNVELKNNTNHTNQIDEHSLFLCGQLADDFVNAVFTKIRKSKKLLKELGFSNETDQSCDRCIETKAIKLPDLEIMKCTLDKCTSHRDLKHTNSKCNAVPEPMENFVLMLLSLGKDEEDSVHSRLRDDSSFIFSGDDFESSAKNENSGDTNGKYNEDRDIFNKASLEKQHLREEIDEEKIENKALKHHILIPEGSAQDYKSKDTQEEVHQSNDEEVDSSPKRKKILENKGTQPDLSEQQILQTEENVNGNELVEVFDNQDSLSAHRKYPIYNELQTVNGKKNMKDINNKITSISTDFNNDKGVNDGSKGRLYQQKNYLIRPRSFLEDKRHVQSNVLGLNQEHYQGENAMSSSNINGIENRDRYQENLDRYDKSYGNYRENPPSRFIQSRMPTNNNKYPDSHLPSSAIDNNMEYQLYPGQMKEPGSDVSYNALPFYDDNLRMGKRETAPDSSEEDGIFFEIPDIEYDLY